jgi:hypothetical protein
LVYRRFSEPGGVQAKLFGKSPGILAVSASDFKKQVDESGPLRSLLGRYVQAVYTQAMHSLMCSSFHPIEERLTRW